MGEAAATDSQMSFWDHLDELRGSLIRSLIAVCLCSCIGLVFKDLLFDGVILAPSKAGFCLYRWLGWDFSMNLINVDISAQFMTHLKAAFAAGLVIAFPYIIWEVWKFISPALYDGEKKAVGGAFLMSSGLFYLGVAVGFFIVLPVCLRFFVSYTVSSDITNSITLASYMSMFISMVLLIGVVFELPTIMLMLSRIGVVNRDLLRKGRKIAVILMLLVAALITPADPFSMLVLAVPLYLLYEFSILLCK